MVNNEFAVERAAGIDMVPLESAEWNLRPDDGAAILRHDFQCKVLEQLAMPSGAEL